MKKFLFLTYGFEKPTQEIMDAWKSWFESIKDNIIEKGHLPRGLEISKSGETDLPMGLDSITGYLLVNAESFEDAQKMAQSNPYVASIRVYEVMTG